MKLLILLSLAFSLITSVTVFANEDAKIVKVSVGKAYIPHGFDNNDVAKITVEGFFPNTCYKLKKQEKEDVVIDKETKEIRVTQRAYKYNQQCLMMMVPFTQTIEVGTLKDAGKYQVKDALNRRELGDLPVSKSETPGPDDHTYAVINDAYLSYIETDERVIVLRGELPGSCWRLDEKKVFMDGQDVLTVLPIMIRIADDNCDQRQIPFVKTVKLPELKQGRYLLNVRSLNGQAVNKLFDVQ